MHRRVSRVLLVLSLAGSLAACSSSSGSPSPSGASASGAQSVANKGVAPDTDTPSSTAASTTPPTSAPPTTLGPTRTRTPPAGLRDFSDVTYPVPSGFEVTTAFSPLTPLETDYSTHYLVPVDATDPTEVIALTVYSLPRAKTVTARTNQPALIKAYNTKAKAVVRGSIRKASSMIDGLPAYTETATESGLTYIAYWAFGTRHFLQFSCQLGKTTSGAAGLAVACGTVLASLQLN